MLVSTRYIHSFTNNSLGCKREVNIVFEEALELTAPDIKDIPGCRGRRKQVENWHRRMKPTCWKRGKIATFAKENDWKRMEKTWKDIHQHTVWSEDHRSQDQRDVWHLYVCCPGPCSTEVHLDFDSDQKHMTKISKKYEKISFHWNFCQLISLIWLRHCDQEPDAETGSNRHLRHPEAAKHASQTGKVCKNFECKMIPVRKN